MQDVALGNTLQRSHVIRVESTASQASALNIVDHINRKIIHATHAEDSNDGQHLMVHHYGRWIPEDQTISDASIVKVARSLIDFQEKRLSHWESMTQRAFC